MIRLLASVLLALLLTGCGTEIATRDDGMGGVREVTLPDDPFFSDHIYPGAVTEATQKTPEATTVWLSTDDDLEKVNQFYTEQLTDAAVAAQADRSYYVLKSDDDMRRSISVSKGVDKGVQITLETRASQ